MEDRELLELAAKAAGLSVAWSDQLRLFELFGPGESGFIELKGVWNPLEDDGDALRLAVKLGVGVNFYPDSDSVAANIGHDEIVAEMDDYGTRYAIVRVAAEIGRKMP